jgi:hypothetical protein
METTLRRAIYDTLSGPKRVYTPEERQKIKAKKEADRLSEKQIQRQMRDQEIKQGWRFKYQYTEEDNLNAQRARDADPCYEEFSGRTSMKTPIQQVFEASSLRLPIY